MLITLYIGLIAIPIALQRWLGSREQLRLPRPLDLGLILSVFYNGLDLLDRVTGIYSLACRSCGPSSTHGSRCSPTGPSAT